MTSEDYKRLDGSWAQVLAAFPKEAGALAKKDSFYSRFEFGVYRFMDPLNGRTAELTEQIFKQTGRFSLRWKGDPASRVSLQLYNIWQGTYGIEESRMGSETIRRLLVFGQLD